MSDMPPVVDLSNGALVQAAPTFAVDKSGNYAGGGGTASAPSYVTPANGPTYWLAGASGSPPTPLASLGAGQGATPVTGIIGASYNWFVQASANGLQLQYTVDGTTWYVQDTASANGSKGEGVGSNSSMRIFNPTGAAITNIISNLS